MYQHIAWVVSISLIAILAIVFIYVVVNSRRDGNGVEVAAATGRWRGRLLWGVTLVCIPVVAYSLTGLPYARKVIANMESIKVQAIGHQWYWELSQTEFQMGKQVEFQVTSADVNHGFAIYGPDMKIVTQTQGMPGVTNVLRYTFEQPGTYKIMCLEYCGVAHHSMMTELHVVAQ
jgi:cytochrome c oxidase subunit 2